MKKKGVLLGLVLFFLLGISGTVPAAVYNLEEDWSDVLNPNGAWSFTYTLGQQEYTYTSSDWGTQESGIGEQTAWIATDPAAVSSVFKANGNWSEKEFVLEEGNLVVHTPTESGYTSISWTSGENGYLSITGSLWSVRVGRSTDWAFYLNDTLLVSGALNYDNISSVTLDSLAQLAGLSISSGDVIELRLSKSAGETYGDYTGIDLVMTTTPVPVPSAIMLVIPGLLGLCFSKRKFAV